MQLVGMFMVEDLKCFHQPDIKFSGGAIILYPLISVVIHYPIVSVLFIVAYVLFVDTDVSLILVDSSSPLGTSIGLFNTESKVKSEIWVALFFVGLSTRTSIFETSSYVNTE